MAVKFIKSTKGYEIRWFNEFVNFKFTDGPVDGTWGLSKDISSLLDAFFENRRRVLQKVSFEEYYLVNQYVSRGGNDQDFVKLQEKMRKILDMLMNTPSGSWSFEVNQDQSIEDCIESWFSSGYGIHSERWATIAKVEIDEPECRSKEWPPIEGFEAMASVGINDSGRVAVSFMPENLPNYFFRRFLACIENQPLSAFLKCKACSNYIIKFGKYDKEFCSNKCASRFGARRRREGQRKENE